MARGRGKFYVSSRAPQFHWPRAPGRALAPRGPRLNSIRIHDFLTLSLHETSTTSHVLLLLSCLWDGSFEPQHDTLHYGVLLDDPHERTRPPRPLLVNLARMRTTGMHAQLAPTRGCKSISKASECIVAPSRTLLGS